LTEYRKILISIDEEWRRIAALDNFECEKCGECCRSPIPVSRYLEALLLLEHFGQLNEAKRNEILQRARLYKLEAKRRGYPKYPSSPLFGAEVVLSQVASDLRGIACPLLARFTRGVQSLVECTIALTMNAIFCGFISELANWNSERVS